MPGKPRRTLNFQHQGLVRANESLQTDIRTGQVGWRVKVRTLDSGFARGCKAKRPLRLSQEEWLAKMSGETPKKNRQQSERRFERRLRIEREEAYLAAPTFAEEVYLDSSQFDEE